MTSAIISITQGDFLYIDEWIQYHHNIGFDLFLIAYNGDYKDFDKLPKYDYVRYFDISTNPNNNIFNEFDGIKGKITWPYIFSNTVNILYNEIKIFFKDFVKYVAIIDTDEFITPLESYDNITNYLDNIYNQNLVSEYIQMKIIKDNDLIYYENKPVLERFDKNKFIYCDDIKWHKKSIINIQNPKFNELYIYSFHENNFSDEINTLDNKKIILNHYYTKSLEEWIMKMDQSIDKDYFTRFYNHMFTQNAGYFKWNKITNEKIKAIPELLKKYNIKYDPSLEENDDNFKELYNKINNIDVIDYKIYCTYHDQSLIKKYNLKETNNFKLFYTNDNINGYSLNYVQKYLCEFVTQYYIWKNNKKSEYIGFCHYRRIININNDIIQILKSYRRYFGNFGHLRFANNIKDEWLLGGLNNHIELIKEYIKNDNYFCKFFKYFDNAINNQKFIAFSEIYICEWEIFIELIKFVNGYIQFLFYKLLNIEYKELYEYKLEEYQKISELLNNINWNLYKEEHIKKGDWDDNNPFPFYGGDRALAFMIEMVEGLFWELYRNYTDENN